MADRLDLAQIPAQTTKDAKNYVPVEAFRRLSFWGQLTDSEQNTVQSEGQLLAAAMIMGGISDLAKGEHLAKLHEVLEPKRCFVKFLAKFTKMSPKQAYRYINGWNNARERLTDPVLKLAMTRNMRIFGDCEEKPLGIYTKAVEVMGPPPKSADPMQAGKWLDGVEKTMLEQRKRRKERSDQGEVVEITTDPESTLKEAYRVVSSHLKKSGATARSRRAWLEKLVGMLMTDYGAASTMTFSPIAIPDGYRPNPVGRPSLVKNGSVQRSQSL